MGSGSEKQLKDLGLCMGSCLFGSDFDDFDDRVVTGYQQKVRCHSFESAKSFGTSLFIHPMRMKTIVMYPRKRMLWVFFLSPPSVCVKLVLPFWLEVLFLHYFGTFVSI